MLKIVLYHSKSVQRTFNHYYKLGYNTCEAKRKICQAIGKDAVYSKTACRWFELVSAMGTFR